MFTRTPFLVGFAAVAVTATLVLAPVAPALADDQWHPIVSDIPGPFPGTGEYRFSCDASEVWLNYTLDPTNPHLPNFSVLRITGTVDNPEPAPANPGDEWGGPDSAYPEYEDWLAAWELWMAYSPYLFIDWSPAVVIVGSGPTYSAHFDIPAEWADHEGLKIAVWAYPDDYPGHVGAVYGVGVRQSIALESINCDVANGEGTGDGSSDSTDKLAATGTDATTPALAALALLVAGAAALGLARRRRA